MTTSVYKDINKTLFFEVVQPLTFGFHKDLAAGSLAIEISLDGFSQASKKLEEEKL